MRLCFISDEIPRQSCKICGCTPCSSPIFRRPRSWHFSLTSQARFSSFQRPPSPFSSFSAFSSSLAWCCVASVSSIAVATRCAPPPSALACAPGPTTPSPADSPSTEAPSFSQPSSPTSTKGRLEATRSSFSTSRSGGGVRLVQHRYRHQNLKSDRPALPTRMPQGRPVAARLPAHRPHEYQRTDGS